MNIYEDQAGSRDSTDLVGSFDDRLDESFAHLGEDTCVVH